MMGNAKRCKTRENRGVNIPPAMSTRLNDVRVIKMQLYPRENPGLRDEKQRDATIYKATSGSRTV